ncbi:TMV resistance protein N-like [Neltuma alba]|uniref:TMV resistance protein N-like n=1 Tax=Neltuma alba TaxID=207710 RepID=UPI0010A3C494|nr:TMV resistance protein N-like [Prosopis alba]
MAQGAGSSSVTRRWSYDVFLSFRGKDTRLNFVGHLYESLRQIGIRTFIDDESLDAGKQIRPSLFEAIKESRIAIIIFSQNYATSTFCLDELVQIIECFKEESRLVYSVFYHVDPSDVRHQRGNYGQALADLQKRLEGNDEKLQKWRWALSQAADLSGWHFQPGITKEQEHIKKITRKVSAEIKPNHLNVADYPVGLGLRVQEIISLLNLSSNKESEMVGICGIGGIGKSTIARAVYNSVADNFDGLCFLSNVREISNKHGLPQLQEMLLYKLVGEKKLRLGDFNEGIPIIKNRLQNKKILLILDDVDEVEQLWALAASCEWFGLGSRIIITTRDKQLLASLGIQKIYYVEVLNADDSLQLIERHAFKNLTGDIDHYKDVLNRAIKYSGSLPLALIMIGSHLCDKKADDWTSALNDYDGIRHERVFEVLKVSYDALSREQHKEIFLDLACFFNGEKLGDVINMLMSFRGVDPTHAISVLTDKSLIKIEKDRVTMHDLIEDMGKEIVRRQSPKEPGKRNRLWRYEDILHVLQNNTGTDEIEVIILDLPKDKEIQWNGKAFAKMKKLKVLVIKNARFSKSIKYLPNSLCVLEWKGYPFKSLPSNFHPPALVHLDLSNSCVVLQPFNKAFYFGNGKRNFVLPGKRIPQWLEYYSRGSSMSFWIRDKFPKVALWFLVENDQVYPYRCIFSVHINDTKLDISSEWLLLSTIVPNHIYICDMESIIKKVELRHADRWNQVKVSIKSNTREVIMDKEIFMAVHAYRQQNDFEDIQFRDPRIYLGCNSWQKVQQSPQDWEELEDEMNEDSNSTKVADSIQKITPYQEAEPMTTKLTGGTFDWPVQGAKTSSVARLWTFDVYVSFRGADTRFGFIAHLYESLRQSGIRPFIDDKYLPASEEIKPSLSKAIKESRMAIIVFSKTYAASTICLDELAQIIEYFKEENRRVYSVFYDVDPSEVRHQTGRYGQDLANLQNRLGINDERLQKWRRALSQAADLSGWRYQPGSRKSTIENPMLEN